ncbi:MAG TPA: lipid II flippase MurJ [Terriglobales bacterium]
MGVSAAAGAPVAVTPALSCDRFPLFYWLLTLLARATSAGKEILLAAVLGTSPWKDALVAAWTAPALVASYGNETLPALLTPAWARSASRPVRALVGSVAAAQMLLSVAALLWPRALIALVAPGLTGAAWTGAIALERWLALNIALLGGQTMLAARWNAQRRFGWMPAGTSCAAATVLAALALTPGMALERRIFWIGGAITVGNVLGLVLMLTPALRRGARRPAAPSGAAAVTVGGGAKSHWPALGVLLGATLVLNLVPLAERMAASGLHPGSLAAFDYGERLVQMAFSVTVAPFTAVSFTRLAEAAVPGRAAPPAFAAHFEAAWQGLLTLIAPAAAALAVYARLLTRCIFGWGRFGAASVALTAPVVAIKGAGLELDAAFYFLLFAIYAPGRERSKLPIAVALAAANLPLLFWWARLWGVAGLAAAHVAGCAAALAWIGARHRRYLPGLRCCAGIAAGVRAGGLAIAAALGVRALLPQAALAGGLGGAASCGWAALALAATALLTAAMAALWAPELWTGVRQALAPAPGLAAAGGRP